MTTDPRNGAHLGDDGSTVGTLRPYAAPHLIRLDTRETALGGLENADLLDFS
jgi:hypothetical protein